MNYDNLDGKIIILNSKNKLKFLEKISKTKKLLNIKILTLEEFKEKYFFTYDKEAIYYITKKYNCISQIAEIYINNLYYDLDNYTGNNEKINFLKNLKIDLLKNGLLKENKLFRKYLEENDIVAYNLNYIDDFYKNALDKLHVTYINEDKEETKSKLYTLENEEEEIEFVAEKIVELVNKGVDINKIKLANASDDNAFKIYKTFKLFNIEINGLFNFKASSTNIVKTFKDNFRDIIKNFDEFRKTYTSEKEQIIIKQIINVINNYSFASSLEDVKDMIFNDIDNITIPSNKKTNAVSIIDFLNEDIYDDEYVFLIGFNQGKVPINYKDEDFLTDEEKKVLGASTSITLNKLATESVVNKVKSTKHLVVTYPKNSLTEELYISNAYDESLFEEEPAKLSLSCSNSHNKIILSSLLDEFYKYGTESRELYTLYNHYKDFNYLSYDNKFSGIKKENINLFFKDGLTLSYSSIDDFYHCSFKYYLKHVLKIEKYIETFDTIIGSIFHFCLSKCFNDNFDFDNCFNEALLREIKDYKFSESEKYFIEKLKEELKDIIKIVKHQISYSSITKSLYEKRIVVKLDEEKNIIFKGFVDKILFAHYNDEDVCFIIDYKTGTPKVNLDNLEFGLDMQLPVYLYLIKKTNSNLKVGGFYLQKILNNTNSEEEKTKNMKLDGYSLNDTNIINLLDNTYQNSLNIKGMKLNKEGNFSRYAKVLKDLDMERIEKIVDAKIKEAADKIINGLFDINPKKVDGNLTGCMFCKFKDICFMKNEDVVELKSKKFIEEGDSVDKVD